jgi:hypothetical protein
VATLAEDSRSEGIRAAWRRYVVLLAGVGLVLLVATIAVWPYPYALAVEQFMLPQYEATFGFRGGRLPIGDYTGYALVAVVPGGGLALAGAKSNDMPFEHDGGIWAFYGALQDASSGREGRFHVLAHSDYPDWGKRREIVVTALDETRPR